MSKSEYAAIASKIEQIICGVRDRDEGDLLFARETLKLLVENASPVEIEYMLRLVVASVEQGGAVYGTSN
jgi:hypothetical protein